MRLLDTSTLTFCEVTDPWHTEYAILSHRWYTKELSFADMRDLENVDEDLHPSRDKLRDFCRVACDRGYKWAWIDTVCIDKTSSAELQESINSTYCLCPLSTAPEGKHSVQTDKGFRHVEMVSRLRGLFRLPKRCP